MARMGRVVASGLPHHVTQRGNRRMQTFFADEDYRHYLALASEWYARFDVSVWAYCLMPNHWHLVLYPEKDGDLAKFMGWLSNTHTRRWHTAEKTIGHGHLYQGRYKSFLCQIFFFIFKKH